MNPTPKIKRFHHHNSFWIFLSKVQATLSARQSFLYFSTVTTETIKRPAYIFTYNLLRRWVIKYINMTYDIVKKVTYGDQLTARTFVAKLLSSDLSTEVRSWRLQSKNDGTKGPVVTKRLRTQDTYCRQPDA